MARGKQAAAHAPKPLAIPKDWKKNKSSDIIPMDPPKNLTFNGARSQTLPYDYLVGVQYSAPQVSVLPPAYFSQYTSMLGNRAAVYRDYVAQVSREQAEARFISKVLDNMQGGPNYKNVPGLNLPSLKKYAAEAGRPIPDFEDEVPNDSMGTEESMVDAGMYVPDTTMNRPGFMENVEASANEVNMREPPIVPEMNNRPGFLETPEANANEAQMQEVTRTDSNASEMSSLREGGESDIFLPMPPQMQQQKEAGTQADDGLREELLKTVADLTAQYEEARREGLQVDEVRDALQKAQEELKSQESAKNILEARLDSAQRYNQELEAMVTELEEKLNNQRVSKRRRPRADSESIGPDRKEARREVSETPPPADTSALVASIYRAQNKAEADALFQDYVRSFNDRGVRLDMPVETVIEVSLAVQTVAARDRVRQLERQLLIETSPQEASRIQSELVFARIAASAHRPPRLSS